MKFRNLFTTSLAIGFILFVARINYSEFTASDSHREVNREDVLRRTTVLLSSSHWVEFQVPAHATNIRMMTNAALKKNASPTTTYDDPRTGQRYSIQYELLDANRNRIDASDYHFRSQAKQIIDPQSGETISPLFFGKSSIVATQTRVMQLPLDSNDQKVAIVRVKVLQHTDSVREVVARVHSRVERSDYQKNFTWSRLTKSRREKICQFCVYNDSLLTETERTHLMRWQWTPAPTLGEFETRSLYFVDGVTEEAIDWQAIPEGKLAMAHGQANFPVPSESGTLRLHFTALDESTAASADIIYLDQNSQVDHQTTHDLQQDTLELSVVGGMVQISPTHDVVIRAYWTPHPNERERHTDLGIEEAEVTPDATLVPTYLADHRAIEFPISHFEDQATPFRVSVRRIFDNAFFNSATSIEEDSEDSFTWELLDKRDNIIQSGQMTIGMEKSNYDHLWVDGRSLPLSDSSTYYFSLPLDGKKIRFRAAKRALLFGGAVRPAQQKRITRIPEDYLSTDPGNTINKSWFTLKPISQNELVRDNRSYLARTQPRVKEIDPQVVAGNYLWNRFIPSGNWIGRRMLVPVQEDHQVRDQAVDVVYREIEANRSWQFQTEPHHLKDKKLVFAAAENPGKLEVRLDGVPIYSKTVLSSRGEIKLPRSAFRDASELQVTAENPTRLFINGLRIEKSEQFLKRTAQRMDDGELQFDFNKIAAQEILGLQLFRERCNSDRCRIEVDIIPKFSLKKSEGPSNSWTILNRVYDLKSADDQPSIVMDSKENVDLGYRCFFRLNEDLPQGDYTIRVRLLDDQKAYALLYQTVPEPQTQPRELLPHSAVDASKPKILATPVAAKLADSSQEHDISRETKRELKRVLRTTKNPVAIESPSPEILAKTQQLFETTLETNRLDESLVDQWKQLGWQIDWLSEQKMFLVYEDRNHQQGRGAYAIRSECDSNLVIQAPHRFFDKQTGSIALKLFSENSIKAACWNTAHRKEIDVAHQDRHYFNAFMNALTANQPDSVFVQLHGFADSHRDTEGIQLIVSDATRYPGRHARQSALKFKERFGIQQVRLFPTEVKTLGGTKNSQASILRNGSQCRFLHLEMATEFRSNLAESASDRERFFAAIRESIKNSND